MSDILKILNSLTDIASLHYNTELAKSQQRAKINQSNAIAERNLQATKERDQMKMTYDNSVRENTEIRKRIDDSLKRLGEYDIAIDNMQGLDELFTSVGAGDLISGKMEEHQGDIRGYSTDFKDNKNLQESLNFALDHNNKVLGALNFLESQAQKEIASIGTGIEAMGDDAFDKALDLSDYIARADEIGTVKANKKMSDLVKDTTDSLNRYLNSRTTEIDERFSKGEITQEEKNQALETLKSNTNANEAYQMAAANAIYKNYGPQGFAGRVIRSQAPTMKESLDMLNVIALKEAREASWQDTSSSEGKALQEELNTIDRSIRGNIETFGGITDKQMSDEYKELLKFGNIAGMKPDSKFFTNPKDIKVFKDNIKSNIRNIIDNVSIELDDNTEKALRTAMSGNDGKVRQVVKALLAKDPLDPKKDVHGLAEDLDLDLQNWKYGEGTTADRTHFAEQLKLWLNLDNKQKKLQGIEVEDTPLPKTYKAPTVFDMLEMQYGIDPALKDAS